MIDLREAFDERFNEAKRELRKTGQYESKAYILHPDGEWSRIRMQAKMHPSTRVAAGLALCKTAGLTGATALIWIADIYIKEVILSKNFKNIHDAAKEIESQGYKRGDLGNDPAARDALCGVFYSPDMTFIRIQTYDRIGKTLLFDQYREKAADESDFFSTLLHPWWEPQPKPASA